MNFSYSDNIDCDPEYDDKEETPTVSKNTPVQIKDLQPSMYVIVKYKKNW